MDLNVLATAKFLAWKRLKRALRHFLTPLDYPRSRELPALLSLLPDLPGKRAVLDISSPQMLSVHLALKNPDWHITYLNPFPPEVLEQQSNKLLIPSGNLECMEADARSASVFGEGQFDLILSSSVLEHVYPCADKMGDSLVMENAARWLKPGGYIALTVPFARETFDEYTPAPVYKVESSIPGECFFQRRYDAETIQKRLVEPSKLSVKDCSYLGENVLQSNPRRHFSHLLGTGYRRCLLGSLAAPLVNLVMSESKDWQALKKPYIAIMLLGPK